MRKLTMHRIIAVMAAFALSCTTAIAVAPAATAQTCRTHGGGGTLRTCSEVTSRQGSSFKVAYRDAIINDTSRTISGTCRATESKTTKHTVSGSLSTGVKAGIFAEMDLTAGYALETSLTTGYETSGTFNVPARSRIYCDRGTWVEKMSGYSVTTNLGPGGGRVRTNWSSTAPERNAWKFHE
jgi:hypothetical protein